MSELRQDPTTLEWVIIATERARRPDEFRLERRTTELPAYDPNCPFCPGNEHLTPPETYSVSGEGGWRVRVVPNKFAALAPTGGNRRTERGSFRSMEGYGLHEVVIETPLHNGSLATAPVEQVEAVLRTYRQRQRALNEDRQVKLVVMFKNHGERAGTSLVHPHTQIVATPVVPPLIRRKFEVAIRLYDSTGRCVFMDMMHDELAEGSRIVMDTPWFVAFHPFASRAPFETWVMPKEHRSSFADSSDETLRNLASVLRSLLARMHRGLNNPDYNLIIHSAPIGDENREYFLWHLQIIPRLTDIAGFELGSGIYITTAAPEETAEFIRRLD
jgi:UDPglucose--hexose-1-phosphate uridylyltransferase